MINNRERAISPPRKGKAKYIYLQAKTPVLILIHLRPFSSLHSSIYFLHALKYSQLFHVYDYKVLEMKVLFELFVSCIYHLKALALDQSIFTH